MANILNYDVVPIVVLVAILLVVKYKRWFPSTYINSTPKNSPPSPQKLPIIGNLHQLGHFSGTLLHCTLQALSKVHGPLMLLHLGSVPLLVVSSAEAAREIMQTHDRAFASRAKSTTLDILSLGRRDIAFAAYSANWRQLKAICAQNLLSPKKVREFRSQGKHGAQELRTDVRGSMEPKNSEPMSPCFKFAVLGHWAKVCKATQKVIAAYKAWRAMIELNHVESNLLELEKPMRISDQAGQGPNFEIPDFDHE